MIMNIVFLIFTLVLHTNTYIQDAYSQAQNDAKYFELPWQENIDKGTPAQIVYGQEVNTNAKEIESNSNDKMEHSSNFKKRLKMLPVKVTLQLMKTKNGLSNGLSKTMRMNTFVDGVQESSGALFGLFKDGIGNIRTLAFGN